VFCRWRVRCGVLSVKAESNRVLSKRIPALKLFILKLNKIISDYSNHFIYSPLAPRLNIRLKFNYLLFLGQSHLNFQTKFKFKITYKSWSLSPIIVDCKTM